MALDCTTCGACCISPFPGEGYIQLQDDEPQRLERLALPVLNIIAEPAEDRLVLLGTKNYQHGRHCCILFAGETGVSCRCTHYEQRPLLCRQFMADTPECHQARKALGLET